MSSNIQFLNFDEAVAAANKHLDEEFVGLQFVPPFDYLGAYTVFVASDEPEFLIIDFEGGPLFEDFGEQESYSLNDIPAEAKALIYARLSELGDGDISVMGMKAEYVLQEILPGIEPDAMYKDREEFMQKAGAAFQDFWKNS